jgi:hypothetical protein
MKLSQFNDHIHTLATLGAIAGLFLLVVQVKRKKGTHLEEGG